MARSEKTVQRMQLISSGQIKKWMLAFFGVFVLGTLGAFIFILQKDLGVLSRAAAPEISAATACADRKDNDGDGYFDYPDDDDCESATDTTEEE